MLSTYVLQLVHKAIVLFEISAGERCHLAMKPVTVYVLVIHKSNPLR